MTGDRRGSVLLICVVLIVVIAAIGTAWLTISASSSREGTVREEKLSAHYIADSGIQIALSMMVSDKPPAIPFTHKEAHLAGGNCTVDVADLGGDFYQLTSVGTYQGIQSEIEAVVKKTQPAFDLDAALAVQINPNAEVDSDPTNAIPIDVDGANGFINGWDHDLAGNLMADQSKAKPALAMNKLLRELEEEGALAVQDFNVQALDPAAQIQGSPAPTKVDSGFMGQDIEMIVDYVRNKADTVVDITKKGGQILTKNDGSFGTPVDFKTVYVNASPTGGSFQLSAGFDGYGILVIEAEEGETIDFQMSGLSSWTGLIIIKMSDAYSLDEKDPIDLVGGGSPANAPHILGGAMFYVAGNAAQWGTKEYATRLRGQGRISYSSEAIRLAIEAASSFSYDMVSYRVVQ